MMPIKPLRSSEVSDVSLAFNSLATHACAPTCLSNTSVSVLPDALAVSDELEATVSLPEEEVSFPKKTFTTAVEEPARPAPSGIDNTLSTSCAKLSFPETAKHSPRKEMRRMTPNIRLPISLSSLFFFFVLSFLVGPFFFFFFFLVVV
jgi:hypothetical protein